MTSITFDNFNLQSSNIITSEIQHEDAAHKILNLQKFGPRDGASLGFWSTGFDVKKILLKGIIKGSSQSDLDNRVDSFKKQLNKYEKNLDIGYINGTRRYRCSCSRIIFERKRYTVDMIEWEAEFTVSNPPYGTSLDTTTLEGLGKTNSAISTTTFQHTGYADFSGSIRPFPTVKITINSCNGIRSITFRNTREDSYVTQTRIINHKFYNGNIITINNKEGLVQVNGTDVQFNDGFPNFSLDNNTWTLIVAGKSYNIDVQLIYYSYWI